jgi:5-methylthioadenosine/S-adenosylhomocysteine deaminase
VAIGTDGAASNNSLDMFQEMKLAAVLAKGVAGNPEAVPASVALRMATINGAKALRIDKHVGSLETGKEADMIVVDLGDISSLPTYSVVSHLVYATSRSQVSDVWVQGRQVLRAGQLANIDCAGVRVAADRWQDTIAALEHDGTYK